MLGYTALVGDMDTYKARNARREVFYAVPGGAAPLTGLMSLADTEDTDGAQFEWHEQRWKEKVGYTEPVSAGVSGPWTNGAGTGGATVAFTMVTPGVTNAARLKITTTENIENWDVGERIMIHNQTLSGGTTWANIYARITQVDTTNNVLYLLLDAAVTVANASSDYGKLISSQGVAFQEGSTDNSKRAQIFPIAPYNYTQIWRKGVKFTATALRQPMFFDIRGKYRTDVRDASVDHLKEVENTLMFGRRQTRTFTDVDGSPTIVRETGGILWHLEQWEASGGGTAGYRPGGAALTANTDDQKRIINGDGNGALTNAFWLTWEERLFRLCATGSNEKLVIGGTGTLKAIIDWYKNKGNIQIHRGMMDEHHISFEFTTITTHFGTLYLKSHPRFNDLGFLRNCAFVLDMPWIKFRPMQGRDTHLRTEVQTKKFDGREDEFLTEGGFEIRFPEAHAYLQNVSSIATS